MSGEAGKDIVGKMREGKKQTQKKINTIKQEQPKTTAMRQKAYTIALMAAIITLSSCSNDDARQADPDRHITVSTNISGMTRVATDATGEQSFEEGDVISVYAWTGTNKEGEIAAPAKDDRVVNNSHNTLTDGSWVAAPQMLWRDMREKHYFIGVYPAIEQGKGLDDDLTQYAHTLNPDNEEASDLLVAVQTDGILAGYGTVPLAFTHTMAKIAVNLTFRNQWGVDEAGNNIVPTVSGVKLVGAANRATVNLLTKAVTPSTDSRIDQSIPKITENRQYASIVIPQGGVRQITIEADGKKFTYTHNADINFASGKVTTVNLNVGRDQITLDGVTVKPWEDAEEPISGETVEN